MQGKGSARGVKGSVCSSVHACKEGGVACAPCACGARQVRYNVVGGGVVVQKTGGRWWGGWGQVGVGAGHRPTTYNAVTATSTT